MGGELHGRLPPRQPPQPTRPPHTTPATPAGPIHPLPPTPQDDNIEEDADAAADDATVVLEEQGGGAEDFDVKVSPLHGGGDVEMASLGGVQQATPAPGAEEEEEGKEEEPRGTIVIGGHEWTNATPNRRSSLSAASLSGPRFLAGDNAASSGLGGGGGAYPSLRRVGSLSLVRGGAESSEFGSL